jgi:hypothetical protein
MSYPTSSDFKKVINLSRKIGLELNFNKCEIFCCSEDTDLRVIKEFQNLAQGIKICDRGSLSLLGSPRLQKHCRKNS